MARAEFNFGDLNTWINNIKSEVAETASEEIIKKLQIEGPYWSQANLLELGSSSRQNHIPSRSKIHRFLGRRSLSVKTTAANATVFCAGRTKGRK